MEIPMQDAVSQSVVSYLQQRSPHLFPSRSLYLLFVPWAISYSPSQRAYYCNYSCYKPVVYLRVIGFASCFCSAAVTPIQYVPRTCQLLTAQSLPSHLPGTCLSEASGSTGKRAGITVTKPTGIASEGSCPQKTTAPFPFTFPAGVRADRPRPSFQVQQAWEHFLGLRVFWCLCI